MLNPYRSLVILPLNLKIREIVVPGFSYYISDILYLSSSHFCHPGSSHNLPTLRYTCLSICLWVQDLPAYLSGMYEWLDMHLCLCVCVCACACMRVCVLSIKCWLHILHHPPNKSADSLWLDDRCWEGKRDAVDIGEVRAVKQTAK